MTRKRTRKKGFTLPVRKLERLAEEATINAYSESEQATGFLTMIEGTIEQPFETEVLGVPVTVVRFDIEDRDQIVAICQRGRHKQSINLAQLPLPTPRPRRAEWIEAYRYWRRRG